MAYLALYREWRPRTFAGVVGQEHVVRTLVNALKNRRLSHAYLFCGPRGTGKTSIAKILARAVNCRRPEGADPCGECDTCREIEAGTSMDVAEIDAASNRGIDEVRELREKVRFAPSLGNYRVFIVDEVHMLTNEAFNALLKTLEEPPPHAMFILATTEPHRVPLTILSRCQRFDFHRIGDRDLLDQLKKVAGGAGINIEPEALELIVRASEGGLRDALSMLDQAAAYGCDRIGADEIHGILGTVRLDLLERAARGLMEGRAGEVLGLVAEIAGQGKDLRLFLKELNAYLRGIMLEMLGPGGPGDDQVDRVSLAIHRLAAAEQEMRWSTQPRVLLEVAMVRAARTLAGAPAGRDGLGELAARLREVEAMVARLAAGAGVPGPGPAAGKDRVRTDQPPGRPRGQDEGLPAGKAVPETGRGRDPGEAVPAGEKAVRGPEVPRPDKKEPLNTAAAGRTSPAGEPVAVDSGPEGGGGPRGKMAAAPVPDLLKKVNSRWGDIMEAARKACPHIAAHLAQGRGWPLELEGNTLTIGFPRSESYATLALGILDRETNRRELSGLIAAVCQADLRVRLVISDRKPPGRARPQKKTVRPEDVKSLFGPEEEVPADSFEGFDTGAAD